jgi:hypothetical protein
MTNDLKGLAMVSADLNGVGVGSSPCGFQPPAGPMQSLRGMKNRQAKNRAIVQTA